MMHRVINILTLAALLLVGRCEEEEANPVAKVVAMLEDMREQLVSEREADDKTFQEESCFCQSTNKKLKESIAYLSTHGDQLKADINEGTAKISSLTEELKQAKEEAGDNVKSLGTQTELFGKEKDDNLAEQKNTKEAIAALKAALEKLQAKGATLAQVRAAAKGLQEARVMSLQVMGGHDTVALKAFLRQAEDLKPSFLQSGGPFKSYGPQGGQVIGILVQMKEDFEKHLADLIDEAAKSKSEFENFSSAKKAEIKSGGEQIESLTLTLANAEVELEDDKNDQQSSTIELDLDRKRLVELDEECAEKTAEYQTRTTGRLEEMKAVQETIQMLDNDESFTLFRKKMGSAASFFQTAASTSAGQQEQMKRRQAALLLQRAAAKSDAPWLALLATQLFESPFAPVMKSIEEMIQELDKQQKDEVISKTECDKEFQSNADDTTAEKLELENLDSEMTRMGETLEQSKASISDAKEKDVELENEKVQKKKMFEESMANLEQEQFDQTTVIDILNKAIQRMSAVFSMVQLTPGEEGKVSFSQGAATKGSTVINMLESILGDSKKALEQAYTDEKKGRAEYQQFIQDAAASTKQVQESLAQLTARKAALTKALSDKKADSSASEATLTNLGEVKKDLKEKCDFLLQNFALRQEALLNEMKALEEAKAFLAPKDEAK